MIVFIECHWIVTLTPRSFPTWASVAASIVAMPPTTRAKPVLNLHPIEGYRYRIPHRSRYSCEGRMSCRHNLDRSVSHIGYEDLVESGNIEYAMGFVQPFDALNDNGLKGMTISTELLPKAAKISTRRFGNAVK